MRRGAAQEVGKGGSAVRRVSRAEARKSHVSRGLPTPSSARLYCHDGPYRPHRLFYAVARATTTAMIVSEKSAWTIDRILARLLKGNVSVGPKAVLWLKARNR